MIPLSSLELQKVFFPSMNRTSIFVFAISILFLLHAAKSDEEQVRNNLLAFFNKLSNGNDFPDPTSGWNSTSFPCGDKWRGITCEKDHPFVNEIILEGLNLSGTLDAKILCNSRFLSESLLVIDVSDNSIHGENMEYLSNCSQLTHLLISSNQFSGNLPDSISQLKNLKTLDLSHNKFSGPIPNFQFSGLSVFQVSDNNLRGPIPDSARYFKMSSFINNPELCGPPLPNTCSSAALSTDSNPVSHGRSDAQMLMYAGYVLIGLVVLFIILLWMYKRRKSKEEKLDSSDNKVIAMDNSVANYSFSTVELKPGGVSKTDTSAENSMVSSSLIVLTSPEVNGLRFEELLKAPAELLGRGKHGSVYKVASQGMTVAVKRIKDWAISSNEFKQRMRRMDLVKHPNVLPCIAFYSSRQEKLLVYEYQENGSLFKLIHSHGTPSGQPFDWSSRLSVASKIADAIAFMHEELRYDRIPHGNLKSSNVLMNANMEPFISEYGLTIEQQSNASSPYNTLQASQDETDPLFKADTYAFGVILLELITGRMRLNEGMDLASWVLAVVREEWTGEVFDRNLIREGASEERMVNVLQVAIKCVNKSPAARPSMRQVALMVGAIMEDDEKSMDASGISALTRSFIDM